MESTWCLVLLAVATAVMDALPTSESGLQTEVVTTSHEQLVAIPEETSTFLNITENVEAKEMLDPQTAETRPAEAENTAVDVEGLRVDITNIINENNEQDVGSEENALLHNQHSREDTGCPPQCDCIELPGGTSYNCSLPSGAVIIEEFGDGINFKCLSGVLRCSEIPLAGKQGARLGALAQNATLRSVSLRACALPPETLRCALRRRGAADARHLVLQAPRSPLRAQHVRGLRALTMLRITDLDGAEAELPLDVLAALPALEDLTLSNARLALHAPLPALPLRKLELADDELQSLPRAAFRHLPRLFRLGLFRNRFTELPEDALEGLEGLQELSLNSNKLRTLPAGLLRATPRLRQLDLYDNMLGSLPRAAFAGLSHLKILRLNDNKGSLQLEEGAFGNLTALEQLELSRAGLRALPAAALAGCGALRQLRLAGGALRQLPPRLLAGLAALRLLDLSANRLARLPPGFFASQQRLTELNLDGNDFEVLPSSMFLGLSSLEILSMRHNKLRQIAKDAFLGVRSLQELRLAHNQLTLEEPPGERLAAPAGRPYEPLPESPSPFNSLLQLTRLDLSHNRVRRLLDDWRSVLVGLRELNLYGNYITDLNYVNANFLSPEVTVNLGRNNISTVLWGESGGSAVIHLDENPFDCDCHLPPLQAALRAAPPAGPRLVARRATCAAPPALRGRELLAVPRALLACELPPPACPRACRCLLRPDVLQLDCAALPAAAALPAPRAHGLAATELRLRRAPASLAGLPPHVRALNLSGLGIAELPRLPPGLEVDLSGNLLTRVPPEALVNNTLRLARNPLACQCSAAADVAALQRASAGVADWGEVRCAGGGALRRVAAERLCAARGAAALGAALALLAAAAAAAALLARRYRAQCLLCAHRCGCCPPDDDDDKEYDAFVSFAHADLAFAEELVSRLEAAPRALRVCVHYRDWPLGDWIPAQISRSVERSRRTVVVLSSHFLSSVWGLLEFREAHLRALSEGRARVVVVLLDDVMKDERLNEELRAYLCTNTYLHRDDPWFWAKLTDALRRRGGPLAALRRAARRRKRDARLAAQLAEPLFADKLVRSALDAKLTHDGDIVNAAFTAPSL